MAAPRDPGALAATLAGSLRGARRRPPVEDWQPPKTGEIDIRIARDGTWYHEGAPVRRKPLVCLFASVLRRDDDGEYYLVTPAEKLRIVVEDAPFSAVALEVEGRGEARRLRFTTNCDDQVVAGAEHPIEVRIDPHSGEPSPYVQVRRRLLARMTRPVFYQLVDLAETRDGQLDVTSDGCRFVLGPAD